MKPYYVTIQSKLVVVPSFGILNFGKTEKRKVLKLITWNAVINHATQFPVVLVQLLTDRFCWSYCALVHGYFLDRGVVITY